MVKETMLTEKDDIEIVEVKTKNGTSQKTSQKTEETENGNGEDDGDDDIISISSVKPTSDKW